MLEKLQKGWGLKNNVDAQIISTTMQQAMLRHIKRIVYHILALDTYMGTYSKFK